MKKGIQLHTIFTGLLSALIIFFIVSSFLYYVNIYVQLVLSIILTIPIVIYTRTRIRTRQEKLKIYRNISLAMLLIFGILFVVDIKHQRRTDLVPFVSVDEVSYSSGEMKFWYSDHLLLRDEYNMALFFNGKYNEGFPEDRYDGVYVYDLDAEIRDIETFIDTNGLSIKDATFVTNYDVFPLSYELYVYGYRFDAEGNYSTEIGKIDFSEYHYDENFEFNYEKITEVDGYYNVGLGQSEIYLIEAWIPNYRLEQTPNARDVYKLTDTNTLELYDSLRHSILDIEYLNNGFYITVENGSNPGMDLMFYEPDLRDSHVVYQDLYDIPDELHLGFDCLIVNVERDDLIINLSSEEVITTNEWGKIIYNGENIYTYGEQGGIYDINFEKISKYHFMDFDGDLYKAGRIFVHRNDAIAMTEETLYQLNENPFEIGYFVKGIARYFILVISILLLPLFICLSFRKPLVPKKRSHIYQVKKLTCKKCGANNNVVTFPDPCDYCGSFEYKKK